MAYDITIPDKTHNSFNDLIGILANTDALRNLARGAVAPGSTVAGMLWLDSSIGTNGALKMRNALDSAWITLFNIDFFIMNNYNIRDRYRNLIIINNNTNPNYQIDINADEIILQNVSDVNDIYNTPSVNLTVDIQAAVGVNALDTGSEAGNTWYFIWVIYNPITINRASLLSLSSSSPTMPAGYTYKALVGAVRNNGSNNFIPFVQNDRYVEYDAVQTIFDSAALTINTWTSQSIVTFFPTTTKRIKMNFGSDGDPVEIGFSPRSDGHAGSYFRASASAGGAPDFGGVFPSQRSMWMIGEIRYAASIYYYTVNANGTLTALGWEY